MFTDLQNFTLANPDDVNNNFYHVAQGGVTPKATRSMNDTTSVFDIGGLNFNIFNTIPSVFGSTSMFGGCYGGGKHLVAGTGGKIYYSYDGISWSESSSGVTDVFRCVNFGDGLFIAGNSSRYLMRSLDGITWVTTTSGFTVGSTIFASSYGQSIYIVGGQYGQMAKSSDGISWTTITSSFGTTSITSICLGTNWIACGASGKTAYSTDATTWTQTTSGSSQKLRFAKYFNGKYFVGGNGSTLLQSQDGITWSSINIGTVTTLYGMTYYGGSYLFVGAGGQVIQSYSLTSFKAYSGGGNLRGCFSGLNKVVFFGDSGAAFYIGPAYFKDAYVTNINAASTTANANGVNLLWQLVTEVYPTTNRVEITGLNGDASMAYDFVMQHVMSTQTQCTISLSINGDSTTANYSETYIMSSAGSFYATTLARLPIVGNAGISASTAEVGLSSWSLFTKTGQVRSGFYSRGRGEGAAVNAFQEGGFKWSNTSSTITSLVFNFTTAPSSAYIGMWRRG